MNNLSFNPLTGLYVDLSTGQTYTQNQAGNLNLSQQAARNIGVSNNLLSQIGAYNQIFNQANQGETGLVTQLDQTINGQGPSTSQAQLEQGLGQIAQQQQAQASGSTGTNAAIARIAAMHNTAAAQEKANQDAAILRANEVSQARQEKAGVLGNQANQAGNMYGTAVTGGLNASGQAETASGAQATIDQQKDTANKQLIGNIFSAGGAAAAGGIKSDRNEKINIKPLDIKSFLDNIPQGYSFDYKHPGSEGEPPGKRAGVMAQDLDKSKLGSTAVIHGDGPLGLDIPNLVGILTAAVSYLQKQKADK